MEMTTITVDFKTKVHGVPPQKKVVEQQLK